MPKFFYICRDDTGNKVTGSGEAASQDELIAQLQAKRLTVVNITLDSKSTEGSVISKPKVKKEKKRFTHGKVSSADLVLFCRQLATLLGAGVNILKSLDIISKQVSSSRFYNVIKDLVKNMEAGHSFHEVMARHPKVFSDLWVNLAESGEASGNLAVILGRLATYLERSEAFKKKIISALMYPAILFVTGLGALLFLTIKIIPTFAELFEGFNLTLPILTRLLIAVSLFIRKFMAIMVILGFIAFFFFRKYINTKNGRRKFERFLFSVPVFGDFFRALCVENFSSGMSTLIESGVPILYSLEITERSIGNLTVGDIVRQVKDSVREGKSLSMPMQASGFFEPMVVQMVAVGEEIGDLPQMFKRINTFYQEYVETTLVRFTAMFEPIMLLFMGLMIGIMVIGMFLPIFQIANIGGGGR